MPPEFFVFRTQREVVIDKDYFVLGGRLANDMRNVALDENDILMTLHDHICVDPEKLAEIKEEQRRKSLLQNELSEEATRKSSCSTISSNISSVKELEEAIKTKKEAATNDDDSISFFSKISQQKKDYNYLLTTKTSAR